MDGQKKDDDAIEAGALGAHVRIPSAWSISVGPFLKWPILAVSAGLFIVLVCYGISLVL